MASNKGKVPVSSEGSVQMQTNTKTNGAKAGDGGVKLPNDVHKIDEKE